MGGGCNLSSPLFEDVGSSLDNKYPKFSYRGGNERSNGYSTEEDEEFVDENLMMKRKIAYSETIKRYGHLHGDVSRNKLDRAKNTILSYTRGSWAGNGGDKNRSGYVIPKTTTLLVIGPKGSGKSSLINIISKVFEGDKFASERAQVTFNSSSGEGTYFLQEYMIPRCSSSFCLFDTRSLSGNLAEDYEMLLHWMRDGVCHGELAVRDSDSSSLKIALQYKAQQCGSPSSEIRKVNFVIFVVNGLSVLRAMNGNKEEDIRYMDMVMKTFRCPYLSFRDDKPVIVITHGDLLSLEDRACVHVYLGEKLDVLPTKQIFDIPENSDSSTESTIIDMIRYSLELADKNLPFKRPRVWLNKSTLSPHGVHYQVFESAIVLTLMFLAVFLGIAFVAFPVRSSHKYCKSQINRLHRPCGPPLTDSPSYSGSNPGANQFHENQRCEYQDSLVTSESGSNSSSESVATVSESRESHGASTPTMPTKLNPTVSTPSLNWESVATTFEHEKLHCTSASTVPARSNAATSLSRTTSESGSISPSESVATVSESRESHGTSTPTMPTKLNPTVSTPSLNWESVATTSEHEKLHCTSAPTVPARSNAATSLSRTTSESGSNSPSESVATVSESRESHGTSTPTMPTKLNPTVLTPSLNSESVATTSEHEKLHCISAPTVPARSNAATSLSRTTWSEDREPYCTSRPIMPTKSNAGFSIPTSSSGDMAQGPSKHRKPKSPPRKKRHPKPATKWHKIQYLWAAPEEEHPEPAIEWSKIRHFW